MSLPSAKKRKIFDGRYEVISIVGRGLDSVVYHAKHLSGAQHEVALKVLVNNKPKSSITERLRKEALTLVSCRHKYVVRLDDFHSVADLCYLSMEYAPLGDLRKYLTAAGKPLSPEAGALFLKQSLEGIDFIHATGVLHRDIKPDNILLINEKEIRLADFGLALLPGDEIDLEELQNGVGSLAYIPPELLEGASYDSRSDLYSLGVCFYEALSGTHPFEKASLSDQLDVRRDGKVTPLHDLNPNIPRNVSAVISTLMRYSAEDRFQTAIEALRALADTGFTGESQNSPSHENVAATRSDTSWDDAFNLDDDAQPSLEAANQDIADPFGNDDFADLFDPPAEIPAVTATESEATQPQRSQNPTEEFTAHRIQEMIQSDSRKRADTESRRIQIEKESTLPLPTPPAARSENLTREETADEHAGFSSTPPRSRRTSAGFGSPERRHPLSRLLMVGGVAALFTILLVAAPHLKPSALVPDFSSTEAPVEDAEVDNAPESTDTTKFPHLTAGTYAGTIQGILPGITSPLALVSHPEHNKITVIVGLEGWSPAPVSTVTSSGSATSTIVVRSNGVLLNMTGETSGEEVTGTFSNSITGETGTWSVRKIS